MTDYFFDSSGLTKRYIIETGTGWVQGTIAPGTGNTIFIAQITPVEVMSAVSRHKRDKNISPRTARAIRLLLNRHTVREYQVIYLDDPIIQHAQDLLDTHSLRAFDAVQLATALAINLRLVRGGMSSLIFVSADTRLTTAAVNEGLPTHIPA